MEICQGILLAGGHGNRLKPITSSFSKQLLPVFDKPMIYYPLTTLMLAGIRRVLLISTPEDSALFQRLLGNGSKFGMQIDYARQPKPRGIAEAILIGGDQFGEKPLALALGDNLFHGRSFSSILQKAASHAHGATVFAHPVQDQSQYGIVELDRLGQPISLVEKPIDSPSHLAVTGLYFFDSRAVEWASSIRPSSRGELEITALNQKYLEQGLLRVEQLERGFVWLDMGTHESYFQAVEYVHSLQARLGLRIGCPEEIAWRNGWIDTTQLLELACSLPNEYGEYLKRLPATAT